MSDVHLWDKHGDGIDGDLSGVLAPATIGSLLRGRSLSILPTLGPVSPRVSVGLDTHHLLVS